LYSNPPWNLLLAPSGLAVTWQIVSPVYGNSSRSVCASPLPIRPLTTPRCSPTLPTSSPPPSFAHFFFISSSFKCSGVSQPRNGFCLLRFGFFQIFSPLFFPSVFPTVPIFRPLPPFRLIAIRLLAHYPPRPWSTSLYGRSLIF